MKQTIKYLLLCVIFMQACYSSDFEDIREDVDDDIYKDNRILSNSSESDLLEGDTEHKSGVYKETDYVELRKKSDDEEFIINIYKDEGREFIGDISSMLFSANKKNIRKVVVIGDNVDVKKIGSILIDTRIEELDLSRCSIIGDVVSNNSFCGCVALKHIVLPESVTTVGIGAFRGCTKLASIRIPDDVPIIGKRARTSLVSTHIPESITTIGEQAFSYCINLSSIDIPKRITVIGEQAFSYCASLVSIDIPKSVTTIGNYAFFDCTSLASINIPESVTIIGAGAFSLCIKLSSIHIPKSVTTIGTEAFDSCIKLNSIRIPGSVTTIGIGAFRGCTNLTSITMPFNIQSRGYYPLNNSDRFLNCRQLSSIHFIWPDSIGESSQEVDLEFFLGSLEYWPKDDPTEYYKPKSKEKVYKYIRNIDLNMDDCDAELGEKRKLIIKKCGGNGENIVLKAEENEWRLEEN